MMDGDRSILELNVAEATLRTVLRDIEKIGEDEDFCVVPEGPYDVDEAFARIPCSAGHTACYISPYGDVYPCVQFPLPCGNIRKTKFADIWYNSPQLKDVRSITLGELDGCSSCKNQQSCTRCPGLAYMEGNMRGPSTQDCEKSLARTGHESVNLKAKKAELVARQSTPPKSAGTFIPLSKLRSSQEPSRQGAGR
jgi:radical SAM protein with 4Fe4S-binding SPASM domain